MVKALEKIKSKSDEELFLNEITSLTSEWYNAKSISRFVVEKAGCLRANVILNFKDGSVLRYALEFVDGELLFRKGAWRLDFSTASTFCTL
jgi:hypothetical protein